MGCLLISLIKRFNFSWVKVMLLLQDGVHAPSSAKAKVILLPVILFH